MQSTVLVWPPTASGLFCDLPLANELGSQVGNGFYLGFYVAFNTVQVISLRVVGRAEETST